MSECEKCIRAQDQRDPMGAASRARMRALIANLPQEAMWTLPEGESDMTCIDCPACGGHFLVEKGAEWCFMCQWELGQVEKHSGPPVETGWKVGDLVRWGWTTGRVRYIDPSGFVEILSAGWTVHVDDPSELERYVEAGGTP
ncbi:hypothetical protein [Nocardia abscessus]|uniref:hypothetical protein n=1 Tax=Nocardia abscessus TaxID=120957 RepID=UPI0024539BEF|nr:hypothetical protein [Nocardia abscessus]